jgi:hypothetical protein
MKYKYLTFESWFDSVFKQGSYAALTEENLKGDMILLLKSAFSAGRSYD